MKIIIYGEYASLNGYVAENRRRRGNWSGGNEMKRRDQARIRRQLQGQAHGKIVVPACFCFRFYCRNRKRDPDNISGYFHKIFFDALVETNAIENDGWGAVKKISDEFYIDRLVQRVEIDII